ncbi:fibronectin type III domain-containing protein [Amycolatopsis pigmentata]|uniref:Fibronectin type III domain-containing protein n=1 Tax=Amycolatopsis pigmentata TaxID=450801 RepID=A0ABW5FIC8_9PSEU
MDSSGSRPRRLLGTAVRGRAAVVVLLVSCVAVVCMALTGNVPLPPGLQFIQIGHWVYNTASQSAYHVDGATGQVDARASVPGAAQGSQVTQGDRSGYVVERSRITEFSKSTLSVENSAVPPATEEPVVLEVTGGPYLVYRNAGQIVRLGDSTAAVAAGGPVSDPVATSDGTVWIHRIDNGAICELPKDAILLSCSARLPQGHDGALSRVDDQPVVIDTTARSLSPVGKDGLGDAADIGVELRPTVQIANSTVDGRLAVADPDRSQLHLIDASGLLKDSPVAKPVSVGLPAGSRFGGPVATAHTVVLVDQTRNDVLTYDSSGALKSTKKIPGPGGASKPAAGQDGRIYVDNPDGSHVLVVDGKNGSTADVDVDAQSHRTPISVPNPGPQPEIQQQAPPPAGPQTNTASATVPGAPRDVSAIVGGAGSVNVSWSAAPSNGARITGYVVSWPGGSTRVEGSSGGTTVTGLTSGRSYVISVAAENSAGRGPAASARSVTLGQAADAPVVTANASQGQVSVSWTAPALHGANLVNYQVSVSGQGTRSVSGTSTTFTGLTGTVTVTVRAITKYDAGAQLTGAPGTRQVTIPAGPPTVKIVKVHGQSQGGNLVVTLDANANGAASTCMATFISVNSAWVPCNGTTTITFSNAFWAGSVPVKATIKNSEGTGTDSWSGDPSAGFVFLLFPTTLLAGARSKRLWKSKKGES